MCATVACVPLWHDVWAIAQKAFRGARGAAERMLTDYGALGVELVRSMPVMAAKSQYTAYVWCGVVWCGVVWCGVVWCGVDHTLATWHEGLCLQ